MPIRRSLKNAVKNFSNAQVKVREATSNDPWGPSSTLMSEIADLTYNIVACSEIMQMVWKRINDHGKNWRHVYKALVLIDYIIKTGNERVAQQCKENIFAIQTLKDFQYLEEGKDHGMNVREKAKQLVALLKDDERLKEERTKALKAKERFAQNTMGIGSSGVIVLGPERLPTMPEYTSRESHKGYSDLSSSPPTSSSEPALAAELEAARPSTAGEEELQLQLALAMSREEHDDDLRKQRGDDVKLQMALDESVKNEPTLLSMASGHSEDYRGTTASSADPWGEASGSSHDASAWGVTPTLQPPPPHTTGVASGGGGAMAADPWMVHPPPTAAATDPWSSPSRTSQQPSSSLGPWDVATNGSPQHKTAIIDDEFDLISSRVKSSPPDTGTANYDQMATGGAFELSSLAEPLPVTDSQDTRRKSPADFLGENAALVNLDNLVTKPAANAACTNPFATNGSILSGGGGGGAVQSNTVAASSTNNPFSNTHVTQRVPLNMMPTASSSGFTQSPLGGASMLPAPLLPVNNNGRVAQTAHGGANPFL